MSNSDREDAATEFLKLAAANIDVAFEKRAVFPGENISRLLRSGASSGNHNTIKLGFGLEERQIDDEEQSGNRAEFHLW